MDVETTLATRIRTFLRDLLGSRLIDHLEREAMQLRADYESRLAERDRTILDLRADLAAASAKLDRFEMVLIPLCNPSARPAPARTLQETTEPSAPSWYDIQLANDREQARLTMEEAAARSTKPDASKPQ